MFLDSHTSIGWLQGGQHATLNIILVTLPTWNYTMLYIWTKYFKFYQQMSNGLFGHYRILTTLLGKSWYW